MKKHPSKLADPKTRKTVGTLIALLLLWSLLIALGAVIYANDFDYRKPLIIVGTMGVFLSVWLIALWLRSRK